MVTCSELFCRDYKSDLPSLLLIVGLVGALPELCRSGVALSNYSHDMDVLGFRAYKDSNLKSNLPRFRFQFPEPLFQNLTDYCT
jgi:hypothetical protein